MQYKTVPGPIDIMIKRNEDYGNAVRSYAYIIDQEAAGGWKLAFIQEIPVIKDKGCMAGCLAAVGIGSQYEYKTFNMLVFEKEGSTQMSTNGGFVTPSDLINNGSMTGIANNGYYNGI